MASALTTASDTPSTGNVQTMDFLKPSTNIDPSPVRTDNAPIIVDKSALKADDMSSALGVVIEKPKNSKITSYTVRAGDTVSSIAKLFDININTILWANNLPKTTKITIGQNLTILPVSGIQYKTIKGDTLDTIAKKYGGDVGDIASFNGLDSLDLAVGTDILIPNGEAIAIIPDISIKHKIGILTTNVKRSGPKSGAGSYAVNTNEPAHNVGPFGTDAENAYYIAPLGNYVRTQGIHGYNAVDLGAPIGTPIVAAADGAVIVAKNNDGYNGGYGNYVVIQHDNGAQTLYGHASSVNVSVGDQVSQGEVIGAVGVTGRVTGPHVHFEIRNGIRNPF